MTMAVSSRVKQIDRDRLQVALEPVTTVYRPLQYLGTKLRALDSITECVRAITPAGARVLDLFTGSSVVAQALAHTGFSVTATDALAFSSLLARALLGVDRSETSWNDGIVEEVQDAPLPRWTQGWSAWMQAEREAVSARDGARLLELAHDIPQIWRSISALPSIEQQFEVLTSAAGGVCPSNSGIATTHYAGTYFGLCQAVEIDVLVAGIRSAHLEKRIGDWQRDVLLAATVGAASTCAFSAGKHFAQPHLIRDEKDLSFLRKRVVEDRSKSVRDLFGRNVHEIVNASVSTDGHDAFQATLEDLRDDPERLATVRLIYADPPYTAQQYSRFYHVPEVLLQGVVPRLQLGKFGVTRGLYPEDRFKSRFCSKRKAPDAFADLVRLATSLRAQLLISYSGSRAGSVGNARMVSLEDVVRIARSSFAEVRVTELDHAYRQFNHARAAVPERADPEFLVSCEGPRA